MKHIAFSVLSAALLSVAIAPLAQSASFSAPSPAQAFTTSQTLAQRTPSPLEQRRQDELDRNSNQNGLLGRPPASVPSDNVAPTENAFKPFKQ